MEKKFFETFEIEPLVKKGEKYFTTNLRFAEQKAEMDLWWSINPEKIMELEDILGNFTVIHSTGYIYKLDHSESACFDSRKDAILDLLIKNVNKFKDKVKLLFERNKF